MTSVDSDFTRTFPASDPLAVSIELGSGDITVSAADTSEAVVTLSPASPGDPDALELIGRSRVDLRGTSLRVDVPRVTGFRRLPDIIVVVTVPTASSVSAKAGAAGIRLEGAFRGTNLKTGSGDIWVDVCDEVRAGTGSGDVQLGFVDTATVKTASGGISVERSRGDVKLGTASGDIHIAELGGDARLNTASGAVEVGASTGEVTAKTASGNVSVLRAASGELLATTATGNVVVGVADGAAALLDCSSVTGSIRSELEPSEEPTGGTGRLSIRARTVSGSITIRRAS